ncbi:MAG: lipid-A-disaccharide synthase [Saprospiraceae bacterium]
MRYFILAGEASGDNLGALLMERMRDFDSEAEFGFWGGDAMTEVAQQTQPGILPGRHIKELAFMGFAEVVANLPTILGFIKQAKKDVAKFNPDVLICIDYPGFNLRMSKWAKARNIRVEFYVSPQIWAWRQSRVHKIMRDTDRVICILPFEQGFYKSYGYDVAYTGNPLPKRIDEHVAPEKLVVQSLSGEQVVEHKVLALLPGSRVQEVSKHLPIMLEALQVLRKRNPELADLQPVIAAAPVLSDEQLTAFAKTYDVTWVRNSYDLLSHATMACVASGTATLETALFGVPQVVCYKGSSLSVMLARKLIKVDYIALANLICDAPVVPELIQEDFTAEKLADHLLKLYAGKARTEQENGYTELRTRLLPYDATEAAAKLIFEGCN